MRNARPAPVADVGLGGPEVRPIGLGLHAPPFDGDDLTLDPEQQLDVSLGLLVAPFPEMPIADRTARVDEIERRPVAITEGTPDAVVVVDRDRVVDGPLSRCPPDDVNLMFE